jgi:tRNA(fMet)-specific endonuclease VapC
MRKSLLDSDILSEISKGINQTVLGHATQYLNQHTVLTFTSISVYEGLWGYKAKPAPQQASRFLQLVAVHDEILPDKDD